MTRTWGVGVLAGATLVLAACTTPPSAAPRAGVVTGRAEACTGLVMQSVAAQLSTTVHAYRGHHVVASETVGSGGVYRFTLAPGHYELTNTGSVALKYPVDVRTGSTARLDLPDLCR